MWRWRTGDWECVSRPVNTLATALALDRPHSRCLLSLGYLEHRVWSCEIEGNGWINGALPWIMAQRENMPILVNDTDDVGPD